MSSRPSSGSRSRPSRSTSRSCATTASRAFVRGRASAIRRRLGTAPARSTCGSIRSAASGSIDSTRSRPRSPAASVNGAWAASTDTPKEDLYPMIDIVREIEAVQREVGSGQTAAGEGRAVRLRRTYDAPIEEVWDALTSPARISRWFLPISGDFRLGGSFSSRATPAARSSPASGPIGSASRGRTARSPTRRASPSSRSGSRRPARGRPPSSSITRPSCPTTCGPRCGPGAVGVGWTRDCSA